MVAVTITTDDDEIAKTIEPQAPPPSDRLKAVETLTSKGVPTSVRIDPIIPFLNGNQERLVKTLASVGVKHITSSTYKVRADNWRRFSATAPSLSAKLATLYFDRGEKLCGNYFLPSALRLQLMSPVAALAKKFHMKFGTCRENLSGLNTAACDGSWLLATKKASELF